VGSQKRLNGGKQGSVDLFFGSIRNGAWVAIGGIHNFTYS
jgi:hypothetical protein